MMSYQGTRNRLRNRPKNAQQENIDKQILCLHEAMAEKLIANHGYIPQVLETIATRYESGKMAYGSYLFWTSLMEYIEQPDIFMQSILENSPTTQQYLRQTPFVGILTESERQAALDKLILT
jgi:hypothetical protein